MRRFLDEQGREWAAAIEAASYGEARLLFSPAAGTDVLAVPLDTGSTAAGRALLDDMSDDELRRRLAVARPWGE